MFLFVILSQEATDLLENCVLSVKEEWLEMCGPLAAGDIVCVRNTNFGGIKFANVIYCLELGSLRFGYVYNLIISCVVLG